MIVLFLFWPGMADHLFAIMANPLLGKGGHAPLPPGLLLSVDQIPWQRGHGHQDVRGEHQHKDPKDPNLVLDA